MRGLPQCWCALVLWFLSIPPAESGRYGRLLRWSANLFTISDMFPRSPVGSVVGIGGMAGSVGSALFSFFTDNILQLTHSYASLFGIAASAYLRALVIRR